MKCYLRDFKMDVFRTPIPKELKALLNQNFLRENGCTTIEGHYGHNKIPSFSTSTEKSIWEDNETHFHPDAFYGAVEDEIIYLKSALVCAKKLYKRLSMNFPRKRFRITVSFNETKKDSQGQIETYGSSTVRFYQIRKDAEQTMRIDDLEGSKGEALMEIETKKMNLQQFKKLNKQYLLPLSPNVWDTPEYEAYQKLCRKKKYGNWLLKKAVKEAGINRKQYCCLDMAYHLIEYEKSKNSPVINYDSVIEHWQKTNEFGIPIHDGGSSFIKIDYCPWCGNKLQIK